MSYRVIKVFTDLQDGNYQYNIGDRYPHLGVNPSAERIAELSGSKNRQRTPLIEAVEDVTETAEDNPKTEETEEKPKKRSRHRAETDENSDKE